MKSDCVKLKMKLYGFFSILEIVWFTPRYIENNLLGFSVYLPTNSNFLSRQGNASFFVNAFSGKIK